MSSNVVIVDDRDAGVKYTGSWSQAGSSTEFDGTTTCSSTQGTSASFTFVGSSVSVYGTVAAKNPPDAAMSFAVDKTVTGTFTPPSGMTADVHHQTLWASPALGNGTHTLVITQTQAQTACVLFLDYLMYQTAADTVGPYLVDDGDSRIKYTTAWTEAGAEYDLLHTTHGSSAAGASFSFPFQGKSISFYGDINNGALASATISIDKGPLVSYVATNQSSTVTSNNLIFDSGTISEGSHTLVVTAQNANPLWIDYFLVTPNSPGFSVSSSASTSATSAPSSSSTAVDSTAHSKKKTPVGAIVGPIVAVLLLAALAAFLFFFCRRRRQSRGDSHSIIPSAELDHDLPIASAHGGYSTGQSGLAQSGSAFASTSAHVPAAAAAPYQSPPHNTVYPSAPPPGAMSTTSAGTMMHQLHPAPRAPPSAPLRAHNPSLTLSSSDVGSEASPYGGVASDASGSSISGQPRFQPPVSQILPSAKLMREARETQRWNEAHGGASASEAPTSVLGEAPPQYAE
ncbi:hypothetical protein C8R46DRAFT_1060162 [Mycena filopes]|nr:hypothetical protein C8R46DRAFT_1060162 [Mycena filopes]